MSYFPTRTANRCTTTGRRQDAFESLLDGFFSGLTSPTAPTAPTASARSGFSPAVDVSETEEALLVRAEIPGIPAEDVEVTVERGVLVIKGEKKSVKTREDEAHRWVERTHGTFSRSVRLPDTVDADAVGATVSNGVLTVTLPKLELARPRTVKIIEAE